MATEGDRRDLQLAPQDLYPLKGGVMLRTTDLNIECSHVGGGGGGGHGTGDDMILEDGV